MYKFVDNNPLIEFHPTEYVNDPFIIAQNDNMVAINSALQVDLTGQVCADSLGYLFYTESAVRWISLEAPLDQKEVNP